MTKHASPQKPSPEILEEALRIARSTQQLGQTKEQTKLIAQGIQKGIQQYKKQFKARSRELDKRSKKISRQSEPGTIYPTNDEVIRYKQHWLPWLLLALTWAGIVVFFYLFGFNH